MDRNRKIKLNTFLIRLGSGFSVMWPITLLEDYSPEYILLLMYTLYLIGCIIIFFAVKEFNEVCSGA